MSPRRRLLKKRRLLRKQGWTDERLIEGINWIMHRLLGLDGLVNPEYAQLSVAKERK